jgi:exopolyphosphatase/guanosine-5'-triphosphate,3'-diphosphate pyrophosphatase
MSERQQAAAAKRVAALDLGSNSFHLLVAAVDADGWRPLLRLGEKVQLAAGLQEGCLAAAAIERGLDCLRRFAPHVRSLPPDSVRAVATHALRVARNRELFLGPAQRLLGRAPEVISGEEEAALIFRGVASAAEPRPQLVIVVGGGSTELALGCGTSLWQLASAPLGCVTYLGHFPDGVISAAALDRARAAAGDNLRRHWPGGLGREVRVIGSSGTLLAVAQVLQRQGWCAAGIERAALAPLRAALLRFGHVDAVRFAGLSESRRGVFASGLAIVEALFDTLGIERMALSQAALREGVVMDLLRRRAEPGPARAAATETQ